jgi:hypothetical protein
MIIVDQLVLSNFAEQSFGMQSKSVIGSDDSDDICNPVSNSWWKKTLSIGVLNAVVEHRILRVRKHLQETSHNEDHGNADLILTLAGQCFGWIFSELRLLNLQITD